MMHGLEKSDLAIVAVKPANKGAQGPAEWVERRAGTEGSMDRLRTRWTQSHGSMCHSGRAMHGATRPQGPLLCRHQPKVGAECLNWARSDLCGGRPVMGVPTAFSRRCGTLPARSYDPLTNQTLLMPAGVTS